AVEPGAEQRAALEAVDPPDDGQPGVLHDLLGHGVATHVGAGHAAQPAVVPADQFDVGLLVARPQPLDQGLVAGGRVTAGLHDATVAVGSGGDRLGAAVR